VGNLLFWLGIGAAQTAADEKEAKPADPRRRVIGAALGALLALLIAGALLLLLSTTD
jgi:predicted lipid-binding transport protein (Tim44 family)